MSSDKTARRDQMQSEYDFSIGTRGKHARQYQRGHTVQIHKTDGTLAVRQYKSGTRTTETGDLSLQTKIVKDKYRGSTIYAHVLAELVRAAQYRGLTTYPDIALIMGLPVTGSRMGKETGHCIGEISEDEVIAGRPMLSALVVKTHGEKPAPGFFNFARQLGRMKPGEDEQQFWEKERDAAYTAWRRPLPKK